MLLQHLEVHVVPPFLWIHSSTIAMFIHLAPHTHTRWSATFCDASEQNSLCERALPTPLVQTKNCAPAFCVARSTSHDLSTPHVLESSAHRWLHPSSLHVHGLVWMVLGASVGSHLVRLVRRSTSWKTPCKWTCNGPRSVTRTMLGHVTRMAARTRMATVAPKGALRGAWGMRMDRRIGLAAARSVQAAAGAERRIVVAVDDTDVSERACDFAIRNIAKTGDVFHVLHVIPFQDTRTYYGKWSRRRRTSTGRVQDRSRKPELVLIP